MLDSLDSDVRDVVMCHYDNDIGEFSGDYIELIKSLIITCDNRSRFVEAWLKIHCNQNEKTRNARIEEAKFLFELFIAGVRSVAEHSG